MIRPLRQFVACCCHAFLLSACATGAPVGGRQNLRSLRAGLLSPPSAPRKVPPSAPLALPSPPEPEPSPTLNAHAREDVVALARDLVGQSRVRVGGKTWPSDCTGFVEAVYAQVGLRFEGLAQAGDNGVTHLYRHAQKHGRIFEGGRPLAGDLVFFRETYDQNRDGRANDGLTHVGLVDEVDEASGTVTVIHRVRRGVVRYRMNLSHPHLARDPRSGERLNDILRAPGPGKSYVLAGQLFAAYATLLPLSRGPLAQR